MTAIEKLRVRQQSRMTYIKAGDANSKFFFLRVNGRRRRNFIQSLHTSQGAVHLQEDKERAVVDHFTDLLGSVGSREETINWDRVNLQRNDLSLLEVPFTEKEVHDVIMEMHSEKAPGPDGYIGSFFKSCWDIIKGDLMSAVHFFYELHGQHFNLLNCAHIVLIPKSVDASALSEYRPISLTSSIAKIISKILATRLSSCLDSLVSRNQSAFIKRRSIHDNFLYTQNLIKALHKANSPSLFLKLDIAKAFDTVRWDYLLEVLERMGFGPRWRGWISAFYSHLFGTYQWSAEQEVQTYDGIKAR